MTTTDAPTRRSAELPPHPLSPSIPDLPADVPPELADAPRAVPEDRPRRVGAWRISDVLGLSGAALASLALTSLLFTQLAPLTGAVPFVVIAYLLFVAFYALLVSFDEARPVMIDRVVMVAVHTLALLLFGALAVIVLYTVIRGAPALPHLNFFTQDMSYAGPLDPLSDGGILHAIAGTLIQITIALVITVPLGLTTAIFLNEVPGPFARLVRTIVEAMTALPSIVAGLFIYATAILLFGLDKSGLAAAFAISVMMLPIMIRAADVVFRLVPSTLKEASYGLGGGQWRTVWHVVLPSSRSGLATAVILATARGIGETSPVLLTSGYTAGLNLDPRTGPMVSLPLVIFEFVKSSQTTMITRGFGTAAVLMLLVLLLFVIARVIGGQTVALAERRRQRWIAFVRELRHRRRALVSGALALPSRTVAGVRGIVGGTRRFGSRLAGLVRPSEDTHTETEPSGATVRLTWRLPRRPRPVDLERPADFTPRHDADPDATPRKDPS